MAQAGMPALSRLGFSGLWKSAAHYALNGVTFFQERAIKLYINDCLKMEISELLIWSNMMRYNHTRYSIEYELALVHDAVFVDYFITWEQVRFRGIEAPFEEYVQHSRYLPAYDIATPYIVKTDLATVIDVFVLFRVEESVIGEVTYHYVFDELFSLWVNFVGENAWKRVKSSKHHARNRRIL